MVIDFSTIFVYASVYKITYPQPKLPKPGLNFQNQVLVISIMKTKEAIRLSISEAAKMFGVSPITIRRAIKDQEITYVVVQKRYKLNFESLLRWSQRTTTVRHKRDGQGIGQFVEQWKIRNRLFSPNPQSVKEEEPSS